jgi:molybdate transport repressor ModE-like protein
MPLRNCIGDDQESMICVKTNKLAVFVYNICEYANMDEPVDWNDLRHVLAICRSGSLSAAARELGLRHSSVYRRLNDLERQLGTRLFDRNRNGYRLTAQGEILADAAKQMESQVIDARRQIEGGDMAMSGVIRVSTSLILGLHFLPNHIAKFRATYPNVDLVISLSDQLADLSRRDADVVVRGTLQPPDYLVGRRACSIRYASFVHRDVLARHGSCVDFAELDWIGLDDRGSRTPPGTWLSTHVPTARIGLRYDSTAGTFAAATAGLGAVVLPWFAGESDARLVEIPGTAFEATHGIWVLTHPDLRRSARISAFINVVADSIAKESQRSSR